jgi:sigma-B regulation protein RsbU (phosphoserine phosphatase)
MPGVRREAGGLLRNHERDSGAGAGGPASVFSHDDDASATDAPRPVTPPEWADKLRDIQSITDAALSMLDPRALLDALVERAKEALGADTSAILLLDRRSGQLVATAASGLEEEVRQGVRIPVGRGFAGRIAAQGRPVVLDEVDHTKVINPILLDKGIRSLMGAPLRAEGKVIGVLHVGTLSPRAFTDHDVDLLQLAADRAAVAVQALTAQLDRAATEALQRSLLPTALPAVSGLEMAARYVPGTGNVGGDWYDVFPLPSGEVCAVIGDVAGTGLAAAVIMGRIRSSLQSYALETADPAELLDRLDAKMRYFEPDALATVLCAVISPSRDQIRICSAGHLPPVIARPGQPAAVAQVAPNVLIGISSQRRRQVSTLDFPPGAVLCLYTDGLVERRDQPIDQGIAQLRAAVTTADPEAGCAAVMAAMASYSPHTDDIALLILRHAPCELAGSEPDPSPPADNRTALEPHVAWSGRHAVVTMPAEMDITNASGISDQLAAVTAQSPEVIIADMTATVFCDTSGVHALTRARELAAASGSELRLALGGSPATRIIQLLGLDQIVPVYHDVEESLATPRNRPDSTPAP